MEKTKNKHKPKQIVCGGGGGRRGAWESAKTGQCVCRVESFAGGENWTPNKKYTKRKTTSRWGALKKLEIHSVVHINEVVYCWKVRLFFFLCLHIYMFICVIFCHMLIGNLVQNNDVFVVHRLIGSIYNGKLCFVCGCKKMC